MSDSVLRQVADLQNLTYEQLKELWRTLNGGEPPAYNRQYITKRLAYRIQEIAYGGLSDDAHEKMGAALKRHGYNEDGMPARTGDRRVSSSRNLPVIGSKIVREWNGRRYEVIALRDGFEFEGRKYRSLTAIVKAITGTHWNGRKFFGVAGRSSK